MFILFPLMSGAACGVIFIGFVLCFMGETADSNAWYWDRDGR